MRSRRRRRREASYQVRDHPSSHLSGDSDRDGCGPKPAPPYDVDQDPLCADASVIIHPPLLLAIKVLHLSMLK